MVLQGFRNFIYPWRVRSQGPGGRKQQPISAMNSASAKAILA
jgi:hypothetical protein